MNNRRLLMISTDTKIFEEGSPVRARQIEYAKDWDEVHIIVFTFGKKFKETSIAPNCFVYPTRSWSKFLYSLDASRLGRFIIPRRKITNITCQDPFQTAMSGVSLKKEFSIPLEIQVHTDIGSPHFTYTFGNRVRKALALSHIPKADKMRVVSNKIKNYLIGSRLVSQESQIEVRPVSVDIEKIKNAPIFEAADLRKKYPQFDKIVLMASRLEKEKNIKRAINSWPEVLKKYPKAGLIIVGSGSLNSYFLALISKLDLTASIVIEPWADSATLVSYYKTADVFLNTSLFEGYGMTLVEAQAAGCKIVSTDVGVAREVGARIIGWTEKEAAEGILEKLS